MVGFAVGVGVGVFVLADKEVKLLVLYRNYYLKKMIGKQEVTLT
jgi:hypothetical protein